MKYAFKIYLNTHNPNGDHNILNLPVGAQKSVIQEIPGELNSSPRSYVHPLLKGDADMLMK